MSDKPKFVVIFYLEILLLGCDLKIYKYLCENSTACNTAYDNGFHLCALLKFTLYIYYTILCNFSQSLNSPLLRIKF